MADMAIFMRYTSTCNVAVTLQVHLLYITNIVSITYIVCCYIVCMIKVIHISRYMGAYLQLSERQNC